MKKNFDKQVEKTELVRLDRATRLLCEDVAKVRGCSWGDVVRQFVAEGLKGGFEIEKMAQGLEAVPETLKDVTAKTEALTKTSKDVSDSVRYLSRLQNLDELKALPATTQTIENILSQDREETQRMLRATHQHLTGLYKTNTLFYAFAGFVVGTLFAVALYIAFK